MEAIGTYAFTGTDEDELSFNKGDIVKILNKEEDPNWFKAEFNGKEGLVPKNYVQLKECSWFVGNISREAAETQLKQKKYDGAFLVRMSESSPGDFSLSVMFQNSVQHFKVLRDGAGKYFLWMVKFSSLNQLIDYHRSTSVSRGQNICLVENPETIVEALYDFQASDDGELDMKKGDHIVIVEQTDQNWWTGKHMVTGKRGLIPKPYIRVIKK